MQTLLIASKEKQAVNDYLSSFSKENRIGKFDIHINSFGKAIGIEDVRNFQKLLFLKPLSSPAKLIVLEAYQGITIDAQNALLKVFEEPPNNTFIILVLENKELVLPTILSRCKTIEIKDSKEENNNLDEYKEILTSLSKNSIGDKLKLAQDVSKEKDKTVLWLENTILSARERLIDEILNDKSGNSISQYLNVLISFSKTYSLLKTTNASPRLSLENLFLSLSN